MGIGAPFGMPRIAHTAYERYKQGWCILANDAANGFNEADRFKMLEAVKRESPALAPLFWMGYCQHQPFILFRTDEAYAIILSKQGAKMGCRFGSYVFAIMVHPAYEQLNR